jgi:isoleucyl-tRNA synthetase
MSSGPDVSIKEEGAFVVGLFTAITPELEQEGFVREVVRTINGLRKESHLTLNDHIVLHVDAPADLQAFFKTQTEAICSSILATGISYGKKDELPNTEVKLGLATVWLGIEKQ